MFNRPALFLVIACLVGGIIYTFKRDTKPSNANTDGSDGDKVALSNSQRSSGYFKTHFQDESQFIVETTVTDLAEMACFAADGRLPDSRELSVEATENAESAFRTPVYDLVITLRKNQTPLKVKLSMTSPIWSPETYDGVMEALFSHLELKAQATASKPSADGSLLEKLTDASAQTIEKANRVISTQLQTDFRNPELHEKAALLLAAFSLNECSGDFYDVRTPLCRLTAHLALARALAPGQIGIHGRVADVALDTLMNRQKVALEKLSHPDLKNPYCIAWVRALKARNTGDYREITALSASTELERVACFEAYGRSVDLDMAWKKLSKRDKARVPNYCRIANTLGYSVEVGHDLLQLSLGLELRDFTTTYELAFGSKLSSENLVAELNRLPERCFSTDGKARVSVIGWGQWSMMFQRQLCHTISENFDFLKRKWGVHEEAAAFSAKCDQTFSGLRLYPFVRRFNSTDINTYHRAVDDAFPVTVATPHLVSPQIWNTLCYTVKFAPLYKPNPNPHINEWHKHNPPPGTAYDPYPRMNHPSLVGRADTVVQFEKLHDLAPYDSTVSFNLLRLKYAGKANANQAAEVYQPVLDYSANAMIRIAESVVESQPERYEELMTRVGVLDPSRYLQLGDFLIPRNETKAAKFLEMGIEKSPDKVAATRYAGWLIRYYLKQGEKEKARHLADMAGDVYSFKGLEAKAEFLEETGDAAGAFEWYKKIEERYDSSNPLTLFCIRYKTKTGDTRYDAELKRRLGKLFPSGLTKPTLADFRSAPTDGVLIAEANELLHTAGLNKGDIIVAAQTIRVQNLDQYLYARDSLKDPQLKLIVWQIGAYREIICSPPDHKFNAKFVTYPAR